jgi:cytochrome c553
MRRCAVAALVGVGVLVPMTALGQSENARAAPRAPAPEAAKSYIPGLKRFMNVIQSEHAKLWYAGFARNWPLAAYQLAAIKEAISNVADLVAKFKDQPLTRMLDAVITGPIVDLEKAIDAKDSNRFGPGYRKLTAACNACHHATGNGFIVIQVPLRPGFPDQDFQPRR